MPTPVKAMIRDMVQGALLGLLFLAAGAPLASAGLVRELMALPIVLKVPVVLGGILPFAVCFAATGLAFRSDSTEDDD